jgi:hypothetical protein
MRDDIVYRIARSDPWYADIVNFMVAGYIRPGADKKKLIYESLHHLWDEPYLFRVCTDGLLRRCVSAEEGMKIIERCHSSPYGGHYGAFCTHAKIWQSGFFWPTMYQDTTDFVRRCNSYQRHGNINARNVIPLTTNLQIELFVVWGIDYMGPFPKSGKFEYILVAVDCVSKWVEALPCRTANHKSLIIMFEETIFPRFGTPRLVISDGGSYFIDKHFEKYLMNHGIQHNVTTPYHPQTSGQAETSNK